MTNPSAQDARFQELLAQARAKCSKALGQLLDDCEPILRAADKRAPSYYLIWESPSDRVQETFARAVGAFQLFRGSSRGEFISWLLHIHRNLVRDGQRRYAAGGKRDPARQVPLDSRRHDRPAKVGHPADMSRDQDQGLLLGWLYQHLTEDEREVILLLYQERLRDGEIAQIRGCSRQAVCKMRARAFDKLGELRRGATG